MKDKNQYIKPTTRTKRIILDEMKIILNRQEELIPNLANTNLKILELKLEGKKLLNLHKFNNRLYKKLNIEFETSLIKKFIIWLKT